MSDTIATRIWCLREGTRVTVSLVRHRSRYGFVPATLLALGAAELGGRLLRPRQGAAKSVEADVRSHFSDAEIEGGARYESPDRGSLWGRWPSPWIAFRGCCPRGCAARCWAGPRPVPASAWLARWRRWRCRASPAARRSR